ncbi:MAG: M15 family metallopeptidase [Alphaproteobacteria bacterium]|nr:M15 family metallopeptidase [Alphaproteobacteria bacterium]
MTKRPWSDFEQVRSSSATRGARDVSPDDLVAMKDYRKDERILACNGTDPISVLLAYAQDELIYDAKGKPINVDAATYKTTPRHERVNVFGLAYRPDATFWLHHLLADIVVGAAIHLYQTQRWRTVLYDGLRTVEGAFKLYQFATDEDIEAGLLALPGYSAHNKGLAVDSMMVDESGSEVDMGGHFDHLDMATNSRAYSGEKITPEAKRNRLIREAAFLHSAFAQGLLIAPLRSEFWDDRLPENRADLWRVLDSAARVIGITYYTSEDAALRKADRALWQEKWECWSYQDFLQKWQECFRGREAELQQVIGAAQPPLDEKPEFYHGNFHPIYDRNLRASGKHLT